MDNKVEAILDVKFKFRKGDVLDVSHISTEPLKPVTKEKGDNGENNLLLFLDF